MNTTVVIFTNKDNMQYYQTQYITQIHSTLTITTILLLKRPLVGMNRGFLCHVHLFPPLLQKMYCK